MNRRPLLILAIAVTAAVLVSTLSTSAALNDNEIIKLPTGRTVTILSVSKVEYSKGVMALMVRYQTSLSVDQRKALSEEVDDFFKLAAPDVERAGVTEAIISSNEVPKGVFVTANRNWDFIFEKGPDGKWTRLNRADFMAAQ